MFKKARRYFKTIKEFLKSWLYEFSTNGFSWLGQIFQWHNSIGIQNLNPKHLGGNEDDLVFKLKHVHKIPFKHSHCYNSSSTYTIGAQSTCEAIKTKTQSFLHLVFPPGVLPTTRHPTTKSYTRTAALEHWT